jgi:hypothetical protein
MPRVMQIRLEGLARVVTRLLFSIIGVLLALDVVTRVLMYYFHHDSVFGLAPLFNVGAERSVPTWFSGIQLALAALLLTAIAVEMRTRRDRFVLAWWVLAIIFWYLSLDETIQLHEYWGGPLKGLVAQGGVFLRQWVVVGIPLVLVAGALFLPFVLSLPPLTRRRVIIAGVVFVGAALGLEMFEGWLITARGLDGFWLQMEYAVEEGGEMVGIALFIRALLMFAEDLPARGVSQEGGG